ncbi:MAG: UDP-N-acetylglucosamine 1-carboxyvinyltransferase [Clostridia bacterium]|nr:UDP-N-acetylglucosamine 1-carboxyvinyltransferase [Clostridia bacterium]
MSAFVINGGRRLSGSLAVQGSKNSALPILAATLLVHGECVIHNCPALSDTDCTIRILKELGCKVMRSGNTVTVQNSGSNVFEIPENLMREMRSSVVFLGAILGKCGKAIISAPGGCEIGLRPIDLHLYAMKRLGVTVDDNYGKLVCEAKEGLRGSKITFSFPSVGATENAVLAAVRAKGNTTIVNCAREPEIIDLCDFLNKCGARINGAGESIITIEGVASLKGCEHNVICDRIAAATYLTAIAVTGGDVEICNTVPGHLSSVLPLLEEAGCEVRVRCKNIRIKAPRRLNRIDKIITQPYPGFPTDAQAVFTALATVAQGTTVIVENIFESRLKHVPELVRMGARIRTEGRVAVVEGVERLYGADVFSPDLRGGAALVVAGLCANGETVVKNTRFIDRGYEDFEDNLCVLNADIYRKVKKDGRKENPEK